MLFMKLSRFNNPSHEFNRLVHGDLRFFFLYIYFLSPFNIQYLISWKLDFVIFFWFAFCRVIPISWPKFWVWKVNSSGFFLFFFNLFFFQFCYLTLDWLKINLHNLFWFIFIGLSWSHDSDCRYDMLFRANLIYHYFNI